MPQLNPSPWFILLIATWLVFLVVVVPKTLSHTSTPHPSPTNVRLSPTTPWFWPWA